MHQCIASTTTGPCVETPICISASTLPENTAENSLTTCYAQFMSRLCDEEPTHPGDCTCTQDTSLALLSADADPSVKCPIEINITPSCEQPRILPGRPPPTSKCDYKATQNQISRRSIAFCIPTRPTTSDETSEKCLQTENCCPHSLPTPCPTASSNPCCDQPRQEYEQIKVMGPLESTDDAPCYPSLGRALPTQQCSCLNFQIEQAPCQQPVLICEPTPEACCDKTLNVESEDFKYDSLPNSATCCQNDDAFTSLNLHQCKEESIEEPIESFELKPDCTTPEGLEELERSSENNHPETFEDYIDQLEEELPKEDIIVPPNKNRHGDKPPKCPSVCKPIPCAPTCAPNPRTLFTDQSKGRECEDTIDECRRDYQPRCMPSTPTCDGYSENDYNQLREKLKQLVRDESQKLKCAKQVYERKKQTLRGLQALLADGGDPCSPVRLILPIIVIILVGYVRPILLN